MGILNVLVFLVGELSGTDIFFAHIGFDELVGLASGTVRHTNGVGTDVGDQTAGAHAFDVHALIELLSHLHGAASREVQFNGCILL